MLRRTLALPAALLAAACAAAPEPSRNAAPARPAAEPARPAGPVTAFDGRYVGTLTLNPDRTRRCQAAPNAEREITVSQGRASFLVAPEIRQTLTGAVAPDGSARMAAAIDRSIATTGVFTRDRFLGEYRNGLCSYAVTMRRVD